MNEVAAATSVEDFKRRMRGVRGSLVVSSDGTDEQVISVGETEAAIVNADIRVLMIDDEECYVIRRKPMHLLGCHIKGSATHVEYSKIDGETGEVIGKVTMPVS